MNTPKSGDGAAPEPEYNEAEFRDELTSLIPHLRAFARSICGDATLADDVTQDALAKAWKARKSYKPGTSMKAWTFTILRNQFYSIKRRSWRRQSLDPTIAEQTIVSAETPAAAVALNEMRAALDELSDDQREAIILVGAGGFSYNEAAEICGVKPGTVKSRVSRARASLAAIMKYGDFDSSGDDIGALGAMQAIIEEAEDIVEAAEDYVDDRPDVG